MHMTNKEIGAAMTIKLDCEYPDHPPDRRHRRPKYHHPDHQRDHRVPLYPRLRILYLPHDRIDLRDIIAGWKIKIHTCDCSI